MWWVSIAAVTRESRDPAQSNFPIASTFLNIKPHSMVVTGKNRCLEIDQNLLAVRAHDQRIMEGSQDDPKKQRLKFLRLFILKSFKTWRTRSHFSS